LESYFLEFFKICIIADAVVLWNYDRIRSATVQSVLWVKEALAVVSSAIERREAIVMWKIVG
jgi:hypothetical protein